MRVGLVADTHGVFDPALAPHFTGVDAVLHAGDVGSHGGHAAVLEHFEALAPTTAVRGNVDDDPAALQALPESALLRLAGWTVLLVHILAAPETQAAIAQHRPDVDIVVHGHSHKWAVQEVQLPSSAAGGAAAGARLAAAAAGSEREEGCGLQLRINPGSAGPARFKLGRSAAILTLPEKGSGERPQVQRIDLPAKAPPRLSEAKAAGRDSKARIAGDSKRQAAHRAEEQQAATQRRRVQGDGTCSSLSVGRHDAASSRQRGKTKP